MYKAYIVVGLGFGDEGKGLVTDYLCLHNPKPLVIRFNGGHQAGHTIVTTDDQKFTLSSFGSGTPRGIPTYWTSYCTFSPAFFLEEYKSLNVKPLLLLDRLSPVTTHYDVLFNRAIETTRGAERYGSTGLGFSATIERHNKAHIQILAEDILSPVTFSEKLAYVRSYYESRINSETKFSFDQFDHDKEDQLFLSDITEINRLISNNIIKLVTESEIFSSDHDWETYIFEGAQGILLDVDFGYHPHVTQSNTTSKNALELLHRNSKSLINTEIFYVTRAYQTRHGAGPLYQSQNPIVLKGIPSETNQYNEYQGEFRISCLNIDQLKYALNCDSKFSNGLSKSLVVTCLDQLDEQKILVYKNGEESNINYLTISKLLDSNFMQVMYSFSPSAENLL